jgi:hypothetical protein
LRDAGFHPETRKVSPLFEIALALVRVDHVASIIVNADSAQDVSGCDASHILRIGTRLRADFNLFSKLRAKKSEEDGD